MNSRLPVLVLTGSAMLWGLSWWPMQKLGAAGVAGPMLALLSYGGVGLLSLPLLWRERAFWRHRLGQMAAIALFGGWAATSFLQAMSEGDVVREMLLFYLAPAWSVLGGRFLLKEHLSARRSFAIGAAMAGAFLVIQAGGTLGKATITVADALALSAGLSFAAGNLATRAASEIPLASKTSAQLLGCALLSILTIAVTGMPWQPMGASSIWGVAAFSLIWIAAGTTTTAYGMSKLEAGHSALIILAELVTAVVSASAVNHRAPSGLEVLGGALILSAAAIDGLEQ